MNPHPTPRNLYIKLQASVFPGKQGCNVYCLVLIEGEGYLRRFTGVFLFTSAASDVDGQVCRG